MNNTKLLKNYQEAKKKVQQLKKDGKKIVVTQGSFDMLHIGHGRYLKSAKQHADILIVGIDSDQKIRQRKGPDRPVVPQEERVEMLSYLESVDFVVVKEVDQPRWELIRHIHPDVLIAVQGTYTKKEIEQLNTICNKVVVLKRMATTSTSAKIRSVQIGTAKHISKTISTKLVSALEKILDDLRKEI